MVSRLLAQGYLAALAPRGVRKADILVNHLDGKSPCLIQVKTRQNDKDGTWILTQKIEDIKDQDVFYCLVDLKDSASNVYVLPAEILADVTALQHKTWLDLPSKSGRPHQDSPMRTISNKFPFSVPNAPDGWMDKYLEAWHLLG